MDGVSRRPPTSRGRRERGARRYDHARTRWRAGHRAAPHCMRRATERWLQFFIRSRWPGACSRRARSLWRYNPPALRSESRRWSGPHRAQNRRPASNRSHNRSCSRQRPRIANGDSLRAPDSMPAISGHGLPGVVNLKFSDGNLETRKVWGWRSKPSAPFRAVATSTSATPAWPSFRSSVNGDCRSRRPSPSRDVLC
jgi:hypothetical protein